MRISIYTRLWRVAALSLVATFALACGSDPKAADGIVVAVYSDLTLGEQLKRVTATVMNSDGSSAAQHTFDFTLASRLDSNFVVSFGVRRGKSTQLLLKLQGYEVDASGGAALLVEQTLKAQFLPGKTGLLRGFLAKSCVGELSCQPEQTCDPVQGGCAQIGLSPVEVHEADEDEQLAWTPIGYMSKVPDDGGVDGGDGDAAAGDDGGMPDDGGVPDGMIPCGTDDGVCPAECDYSKDVDCTKKPGQACAVADQCSSQSCQNGFCCAAACSTQHITPSCEGGGCQHGVCEAHYDDCNNDKSTDGCEVNLDSDPEHCGVCHKMCAYGVCQGGECVSSWEGSQSKESTAQFLAGVVYGFRIFNATPGKLAALGILLADVSANNELYVALFEDDGDDLPVPQLTRSDVLAADREKIEWIIPTARRPTLAGGAKAYWFFFTFSSDTLVYVDVSKRDFWRSTGTPEFGPIMEDRPDDDYSDQSNGVSFPNVFLTVVPE